MAIRGFIVQIGRAGEQVTDFLAWIAGKRPDLKTIFVSYSDELGVKVNKDLQRIMTNQRYLALSRRRSSC